MSDSLCINTIRTLAADIVQKSDSGHPGAPMGMAPMAQVMWTEIMKYNPANPHWVNRDRFVLSNGHACALLYIMLHLTGYKVSMDDLKNFRQIGSITPGHPEVHITEGVEVTTGPLGQGISNAVGLAMAEKHLAAEFNKPEFPVIDHYTYVFCGDGCLQEGITTEACSLAGHLGLGKLIVLYDDNHVTIDGATSLSFSEDIPTKFKGMGWHTLVVSDGDHDLAAISAAVKEAQKVTDKPSIIKIKTTIGFGSSKQGTGDVHGSALGEKDVQSVKKKFGFDPEKKFAVPDEVYKHFAAAKAKGGRAEGEWNKLLANYTKAFPKEAAELERRMKGALPFGWKDGLPKYTPKSKADATRNVSGEVLNAIAKVVPELMGGSADLTPSNKTALKGVKDFSAAHPEGRYIRFGVREHGMAAIGNGLHAHGGVIPYTATFLNFITYAWGAVRLAALSGHQQIFVMTHDSIGLGEDGPTHQPIEALAACRATPNLVSIRPADGNETVGAWIVAMTRRHGPTVLALSRQNLPHMENSCPNNTLKGGYVLVDPKEGKPTLILVATGSEVHLAAGAAQILEKNHGQKVRVVSLPSWELFEQQPISYRRSVILDGVPTVAVEALSVFGWDRYAHYTIGMRTFGTSGPPEKVYDHFGFTSPKIAANALNFLQGFKKSHPHVPILPGLVAAKL